MVEKSSWRQLANYITRMESILEIDDYIQSRHPDVLTSQNANPTIEYLPIKGTVESEGVDKKTTIALKITQGDLRVLQHELKNWHSKHIPQFMLGGSNDVLKSNTGNIDFIASHDDGFWNDIDEPKWEHFNSNKGKAEENMERTDVKKNLEVEFKQFME